MINRQSQVSSNFMTKGGFSDICPFDEYNGNETEIESERILLRKVMELSQQMEKFNLAEYMNHLNNPRRYLMLNFMGGLFRGFGIALGMTILGAIALYILQRLVVLNLPIIGDFLADLIKIVLAYL